MKNNRPYARAVRESGLYHSVSRKSEDLAQAQKTIVEFLRQERAGQEQSRKKKKNGNLE